MNSTTIVFNELKRLEMTDENQFAFYINNERILVSKEAAILLSQVVYEQYLNDSKINSMNKTLNLSCNDTLDIVSRFFKTGILTYENDQLHNRDLFEVGKAFGIQFLITISQKFNEEKPDSPYQ